MKKIPKSLLDAHIELSREYWNITDESAVPKTLAKKMEAATQLSKSCGIDWLAFENFIDSIVRHTGFKKDATNEEIYQLIKLLGHEIVE